MNIRLICKIKYSIILLFNTISDHFFDWYYGVETYEEDNLKENDKINYSYQASYYTYLSKIFKKYKFSPEDCLVDFGCGKGRVLIMSAVYNCTRITGVEINSRMCEIAKKNVNAFLNKCNIDASIEIVNENAQSWNIGKEYNKFFFFNPFHLKIFMYVIMNISESFEKNPREIMLCFFGPLKSTIDFMEENVMYELIELNERYCYVIYKTKAKIISNGSNNENVE